MLSGYGVGQVYGLPPDHHRQSFIDHDALRVPEVAGAAADLTSSALWLITGDGLVIEELLEGSDWAPDRIRSGWSVLP